MKAPGSPPQPSSCASPLLVWQTEYLRGGIKSHFEDLQGTSDIYGSIPELPWGPSEVIFSGENLE